MIGPANLHLEIGFAQGEAQGVVGCSVKMYQCMLQRSKWTGLRIGPVALYLRGTGQDSELARCPQALHPSQCRHRISRTGVPERGHTCKRSFYHRASPLPLPPLTAPGAADGTGLQCVHCSPTSEATPQPAARSPQPAEQTNRVGTRPAASTCCCLAKSKRSTRAACVQLLHSRCSPFWRSDRIGSARLRRPVDGDPGVCQARIALRHAETSTPDSTAAEVLGAVIVTCFELSLSFGLSV